MLVTIRHRQAGPARFFVDCEVKFSEEEKAIIQQRGLGKHTMRVPPGVPSGTGIDPDSWTSTFGVYALGFCWLFGGFLLLIGIVAHEALVWAIFWLALGTGICLWFRFAHQRYSASIQDQIIPLQRLLGNPVFTVAAMDVNEARGYEGRVRHALAEAKQFLVGNAVVGNANLKEVETFEL